MGEEVWKIQKHEDEGGKKKNTGGAIDSWERQISAFPLILLTYEDFVK